MQKPNQYDHRQTDYSDERGLTDSRLVLELDWPHNAMVESLIQEAVEHGASLQDHIYNLLLLRYEAGKRQIAVTDSVAMTTERHQGSQDIVDKGENEHWLLGD
ncbi:MAG: hypothetical protein M3R24_37445 [Chloroflexota bacterium]|nr:hypothetical protein [Chloroflexota bacterium]